MWLRRGASSSAIDLHDVPASITINKSGANTAAVRGLVAESGAAIELRQSKYLNNVGEQDHRAIKRRTRPMMGFKSFLSATKIIAGIETMHMKGQLGCPGGLAFSPATTPTTATAWPPRRFLDGPARPRPATLNSTDPPLPASGPRRLSQAHLAFVRSWADGRDLVAARNRYLFIDGAGDARRARGERKRLLEELRILARAHGRPEIAALLRRDPEAIPDAKAATIPALEAFAAEQPADYYSESELVALYQEQYGALDARSAARRR